MSHMSSTGFKVEDGKEGQAVCPHQNPYLCRKYIFQPGLTYHRPRDVCVQHIYSVPSSFTRDPDKDLVGEHI